MATSKKYFGTDGIRGMVGESLINPEFVLKLGWAFGSVLRSKTGSKVLIGKDTRISGYLLESVLEAGLISSGVDVCLLGPMPTPGIAYLTRAFRAQAGIVISASHNPYYDNGIKIFATDGTKISDSLELAIEKAMDKPMQTVDSSKLGKAKRIVDSTGRYVEFCKSTLGLNSNLKGIKIVVDCANGATYNVAPCVLQELGANVVKLNCSPDGFNINESSGSTCPKNLAKTVCSEGADVGIAFDGDGDRVIMVDNTGNVVDGDELLFIMAKNYHVNSTLRGGIIGTSMSNFGLEVGFSKLGIDFKRTHVGDRHILSALRDNGWILGGESSGHIVHLGLTTTGDGIVTALQILSIMCQSGKSLFDLKSEMSKVPQVLLNVKTAKKMDVANIQSVKKAVKHAEKTLGNTGRVLIRNSGTEPLVRVMVEGEDANLVERLAKELALVVKNETGK